MIDKQRILEAFQTKELYQSIQDSIQKLYDLEKELIAYISHNHSFIKQKGGDSEEVKSREAELFFNCPGFNQDGTKVTAKDKEAWLYLQRKEDQLLRKLLNTQNEVEMVAEGKTIEIEAEKRRYDAMLALLRLRESQIRFLSS